MGHWNYRVVKYKDGSGFGLHEVFYDDAGEAWSMTVNPISFATDNREGPKGIALSLAMALDDAKERAVFDEPEIWPGRAPGLDEVNEKFEASEHQSGHPHE